MDEQLGRGESCCQLRSKGAGEGMMLLVLKKKKKKKTIAREEELSHRICDHRKSNTVIAKTIASKGK